MHFSIAPVELSAQMKRQFDAEPTRAIAVAIRPEPAPTTLRQRVSAALHGLATVLDPAPARS
jgi:hypothetical protein